MLKITVCIGSSCHLKGSREVVEQLQQMIAESNLKEKVDLCGTFCMGNCMNGVNVTIGDQLYSLKPDTTLISFESEVLPKVA
jgi:NADH:ubiquinone oxidoreductase subunit E